MSDNGINDRWKWNYAADDVSQTGLNRFAALQRMWLERWWKKYYAVDDQSEEDESKVILQTNDVLV